MAVRFDTLTIGGEYTRPYLAEMWGYQGFQAISRGVITPSGTNIVILFVTEQKQHSLTQYNDYLDGENLHWEGESGHVSDSRIVNANQSGDEIYLFHRTRHHTPFTYRGRVYLEEHNLLVNEPSQFIFSLSTADAIEYDTELYGLDLSIRSLSPTERNAVVKSRLGQGVFRDGLFRLWGGCAVTGYRRPIMLLASHIKPWKDSNNRERLDPYNGLLLHPTIDRLFDQGLITFDDNGKILRSRGLRADELSVIGVSSSGRLRKLPRETQTYLEYHRDTEFKRVIPEIGAWRTR
jgi:putative restriction endonuclease